MTLTPNDLKDMHDRMEDMVGDIRFTVSQIHHASIHSVPLRHRTFDAKIVWQFTCEVGTGFPHWGARVEWFCLEGGDFLVTLWHPVGARPNYRTTELLWLNDGAMDIQVILDWIAQILRLES